MLHNIYSLYKNRDRIDVWSMNWLFWSFGGLGPQYLT